MPKLTSCHLGHGHFVCPVCTCSEAVERFDLILGRVLARRVAFTSWRRVLRPLGAQAPEYSCPRNVRLWQAIESRRYSSVIFFVQLVGAFECWSACDATQEGAGLGFVPMLLR